VDISLVKDVSIIIAGIIALVTFVASTWENIRRGRQERAANFVLMRRRFLETPQYREILDLLNHNDPSVANVSVQERRNFIGFLEEVAMMVNSRLIRRSVAHYMFGHYALLAARSEFLWSGLNKESPYWSVFWVFAREMEEIEQLSGQSPKELSF
jgi:hypothetical protein